MKIVIRLNTVVLGFYSTVGVLVLTSHILHVLKEVDGDNPIIINFLDAKLRKMSVQGIAELKWVAHRSPLPPFDATCLYIVEKSVYTFYK